MIIIFKSDSTEEHLNEVIKQIEFVGLSAQKYDEISNSVISKINNPQMREELYRKLSQNAQIDKILPYPKDYIVPITRREFIDFCVAGAFAATFAAAAAASAVYLYPPSKTENIEKSKAIVSVAEMKEKDSLLFEFNNEPCVLIRNGEKYYALSRTCTHLGCLVNWEEKKKELVCPCHNAQFDIRGNVLGGPPPKGLPTYSTSIMFDSNKGEDVILVSK